jgi:hypothetical protein
MHPGEITPHSGACLLGIKRWTRCLLWSDSWQQLPPLQSLEILHQLQAQIPNKIHIKVANIMERNTPRLSMEGLENLTQDLNLPADCNLDSWKEISSLRKIRSQEGQDILQWGNSTTGTFTIKEAYYLKAQFHLLPKNPIWHTIWKSHLWPKVSTFLWLLVQNRILTWDNLRKKGFIGPSMCPLCMQQEESMEHLLNQCPFSA